MASLDSTVPPQRTAPPDVVITLNAAPRPPVKQRSLLGPATRYLPYRYDIHGFLRIGSQIRLAELDYFAAPELARGYDIELRVGRVGRGPRRRAVITSYAKPAGVDYDEHLGRWGANFQVRMGEPTTVTVSPFLAGSPHVVYTNIIEALLRFALVARGKMLLHSACLDIFGTGVLISARTDTGKTGTVLRMLRQPGVHFLSDDMTIIDATARAWAFPKPLTISQHTLRAVNVDELPTSEWRRLRVQSRLHSKEGRGIGMRMGEHNVPIMAMNALTQLVVPPPKYPADRLVDCEITSTTEAAHVCIIERGAPALVHVPHADAVAELVANTDDAYGFPPFRYLAPAIRIDDADYLTLRARESQILDAAVSRMSVRRLTSDDYSWCESIPLIVGPGAAGEHPQDLPRPVALPTRPRKSTAAAEGPTIMTVPAGLDE